MRVLILEDRPEDAELVANELRRAGFAPQWTRVDTEAAFREALGDPLDLILADYHVPGFGATRALEVLAALGLDIPVIMVSGTIGEELAVAALHAGAADYLMKDRLARLGPAVSHALEARQLREQRKTAEKQVERQLQTLTVLYASAQKLAQSLHLRELGDSVARTAVTVLGATTARVGRAETNGMLRILSSYPAGREYAPQLEPRWGDTLEGEDPSARSLRSGFPAIISDVMTNADGIPSDQARAALQAGVRSLGAFPLLSRAKPFGVLTMTSDVPEFFSPERVEFFQAFAHLAAAAFDNARLYEETGRRLEQLQALREIDSAITGSLDVRVTMSIFLDQVTTHLGVDAAAVLTHNPHTHVLEYAAGRGFRTAGIRRTRLPLGVGLAGRAALDRTMVSAADLMQAGQFERAELLRDEGFVAYHAAPLIAKGDVKGVLEVFHRTPLETGQDWLDFLSTLAGQAAIAVDNAGLFEGLQRANAELTLAYDRTLEGWVQALDLRDKETEGHTQRVTDLTLRLARAMGVNEEALVHVRRGALLHDIGKMAIPDSILLKPGPLTDEEWKIMRLHPVYAHQLLSPIPYLRPALPIPYSHHEKWDGTGYPRGLKREEIRLEARIFAVADVWDALTSDRPYRTAWPPEQALQHVREQSEKHFDPDVVEAFLKEER